MMYGAPVSVGQFLYYQLAVSLGNIVGGMFVMAGSHALMHHYGGLASVVTNRKADIPNATILKADGTEMTLRHREGRVNV